MATVYCSCEQHNPFWGEFWWIEGKYEWVFFDDEEWSETYTERLTHWPACGQHLERRNLEGIKA